MSKQLYIPELGTELKLTKDWTFDLYPEERNETLGNVINLSSYIGGIWIPLDLLKLRPDSKYSYLESTKDNYSKGSCDINGKWTYYKRNPIYTRNVAEWREICYKSSLTDLQFTIPKNSTLIVDRIYIRKGNEKYSSVSFYWKDKPLGKGFKKYVRFWCKLDDANKIKFE